MTPPSRARQARRAALALLAMLAMLVPAAGAAQAPQSLADSLRARVQVLAADSMRGRETGTAGERAAAAYLALAARALGLRPAGENGGFFQRVPLERRRVDAVVTVTTRRGRTVLAPGEAVPLVLGFLPRTYRARGQGELLYAGYVSDAAARAGLLARPERLAGRVPVFHTSALTAEDAELPLPPIFEVAPLMRPASGVPAVIFLAEDALAGQLSRRADLARNGQPGAPQPRRELNAPPVLLVSPAALQRALGAPVGTAREPRPLAATLSYRLRDTVEAADGREVVAVLPGSDPRLRGEYVALGAHYDHLGVGTAVAGDSIYNGADDNASGVAALLEVARRFAALPPERRPARSLLFVWHTGEENGLLGSAFFAAHPTVPRDSMVAYLNLDMIGRNAPDSLYVLGARRLSAGLGDAVDAVNARQPHPFALDYSLDAPAHPRRIYCRSDQASFAAYGIPVVFFTSSLHPQYHTPADEAATLDYAKMARVTALVGDLAAELANAAKRPALTAPIPRAGSGCRQ